MDENKVVNTTEEAITYGVETFVVGGFVQVNHPIEVGEIPTVGRMIVTDDGEVIVEDENIVDIQISEAFPFSTYGALDNNLGDKDILIKGRSGNELLNNDEAISLTEALETCASLGGLENTSHGTLYGTEFADQHPIEAITGLREELNDIETLGIVESHTKNQANYYLWESGSGQVGKFVTIGEDTDQIRICIEADDIFGVTVDSAGFIGGQDDPPKDDSYGLVVTTGLAPVQCELDVDTGDYVISNDYGYAKKSDGNYGYQVVGINDINGIRYAVVALATPISSLRLMSQDWKDIGDRMDVAEKNIASAINVANEAYKMAASGGGGGSGSGSGGSSSNPYLEDQVEDLITRVDGVEGEIDSMGNQISSAVSSANTAKTLANNAISSVESVRAETIDVANNALAEASDAKTKVDTLREETSASINDAMSEAKSAQDNIDALKDDLTVLTEWTDGEFSGVTGFVDRVDENDATLATLVEWKGETSESVAAIQQQTNDNGASIESLTKTDTELGDSIALVKQTAEANEASIKSITEWQDKTTQSIASVEQKATENSASIEQLTSWKDNTDESIALIKQDVSSNGAKIESLTSWQTEAKESITNVTNTADANKASIETLNAFQTDATKSIAQLTQQADDNGASIQFLVNKIDKYSYGAFSQAYSFSQEEAEKILEVGQVYVPSVDHDETYDRVERRADAEYHFTKGYHYTWGKTESGMMRWIESESPEVAFSKEYITGGDSIPYWVTTEEVAGVDTIYEADTLYKWDNNMWIAVATLKGNLSSRETSILKQTTNSLTLSVQDVANDMADITLRVDDNESSITDLVSWTKDPSGERYNLATIYQTASDAGADIALIVQEKDGEKVVNGASIIAAINDDESSVTIDADKINFVGSATFLTADDLGVNGTTSIDGGRILTGKISADRIDANHLDVTNGEFDHCTILDTCTIEGTLTSNNICSNTGNFGTGNITFADFADSNCSMYSFYLCGDGGISLLELYVGESSSDCRANLSTTGSIRLNASNELELISVNDVEIKSTSKNIFIGSYDSFSPDDLSESGDVIISAQNQLWLYAMNGSSQGYIYMTSANLNATSFIFDVNTKRVDLRVSQYGNLKGTWYDDEGEIVTSDKNAKHSIADIDERYLVLVDNLRPCVYRYNHGTSNRLHTGFIAQEFEDALKLAGIDKQECAALCIRTNDDGSEHWGLRYDEIVALNTYKIQSLNGRIVELETKLAELEAKLGGTE